MSAVAQLSSRLKRLSRLVTNRDYRRGLRHGVGAGVEHESLLRALSCKTIVDVGANRGQFSLAARRSLPFARIIAFEPLLVPASRFRRLFISDEKVTLHQVAIGERGGDAVIHVSREDDSSSLLPITVLQSELFPATALSGTDRVHVKRLDAVIRASDLESPCLLKIDVQGYELAVLSGCGNLLSVFEYIYAECSFIELYAGQPLAHQVISYLERRGFRLRGVFNPVYDKQELAVQGDFLFVRNRTTEVA